MGEATYYGKINFDTPEHALAAAEPFEKLCLEIYNAGEYWQNHRDPSVKEDLELSRKIFWDGFELLFPQATAYLKSSLPELWGLDYNNALARYLDAIGHPNDVSYIEVYGDQLRWSSEVWHFADWDPFINYVKKTFPGAESGGYISDEYCDINYFDMIGEN